MSIAVSGASGHLGRQVAELLVERADPASVVLLTRSPDRLADLAQRGADVRAADFGDTAGLTAALQGADRLLLISTDVIEGRAEKQTAAVQAAAQAGVGHLVYTSIPRPDAANPAGVVPSHAATEQAIRATGAAWTFLRNNLYAEFQIPVATLAAQTGQLVTNAGEGRAAYVARTDCAAAAAAVLTGEGHESQAYDITGPQALCVEDVAAIAAELSGRPVEVVQVDDDARAAGLVEHAGLPEAAARLITSFGRSQREGWLDTVTSTVADLTGRPPRALRDVIAEGWAG